MTDFLSHKCHWNTDACNSSQIPALGCTHHLPALQTGLSCLTSRHSLTPPSTAFFLQSLFARSSPPVAPIPSRCAASPCPFSRSCSLPYLAFVCQVLWPSMAIPSTGTPCSYLVLWPGEPSVLALQAFQRPESTSQ